MATYKPLRIGDATRGETTPIRTFAADDTIETPLQVSQGGVVLGRITGAGAHQEILFADLPGGGAASIVEITYADMATALAGATLTPGQYYNITDAAGTDLGFVCMAVQADEITVSGTGGYLNADFQAVGDYSGVEGITGQAAGTQQGIWQAANEGGYTQGDIVIWNLLHWQLTDSGAIDGTDPATNTAAYTQLLKTNTNQGYITAWDGSEFDFQNAWLQYRADERGNSVRYSKADDTYGEFGYTAILLFQWGNDSCVGNTVIQSFIWNDNSTITISRNYLFKRCNINANIGLGTITNNYLLNNSYISGCDTGTDCYISENIMTPGQIDSVIMQSASGVSSNKFYGGTISGIQCGTDGINIAGNLLYSGATFAGFSVDRNIVIQNNSVGIGASFLTDCTIGSDCTIENNILENGSQLTGITAGANCQISRNKIGQGATLGGSTTMGDGAAITDNTLANGYSLDTITLAAAETIDSLNYGQITAIDETTRDGLIIPQQGLVILNTTSGKLNFYTGSAWEEITSA